MTTSRERKELLEIRWGQNDRISVTYVGHTAWVPKRARRTKSRGLKGLQLEVWGWRPPRVLVVRYLGFSTFYQIYVWVDFWISYFGAAWDIWNVILAVFCWLTHPPSHHNLNIPQFCERYLPNCCVMCLQRGEMEIKILNLRMTHNQTPTIDSDSWYADGGIAKAVWCWCHSLV